MKKPQNVQEANALVDKRTDAMSKARIAYCMAERAYLKAKEWQRDIEGKKQT